MRPRSILLFERLFLFSLAVGVVQAGVGWEELAARAEAQGGGPAGMLALLGFTFFTLGGLALLVSRWRMASAKWALVILCAIGVPVFFVSLGRGTLVGWAPLAVLQAALQVVRLSLLFTAEAWGWLNAARAGRGELP